MQAPPWSHWRFPNRSKPLCKGTRTVRLLGVSTPAAPARGRARNNTRLHAVAESCTRFVSGKEAVRAVVRVARLGVWPGPQSAFGHWWRGAVRDPVWETEILAAVPPELPAEGNFRGLLFHGSAGILDVGQPSAHRGLEARAPRKPLASTRDWYAIRNPNGRIPSPDEVGVPKSGARLPAFGAGGTDMPASLLCRVIRDRETPE